MLNIIKMDLFKLKRSKSFYITILVCVALTALALWSINFLSNMSKTETSSNGAVTLSSNNTIDSIDGYINGIFNGYYTNLFVVIFIIIFCNAERKNGYIKNIASIVSDKYKLVLSKIVVLIIYVLAIYAALIATILIACYGFMGITQVDSLSNIVKFLGTGMLMNISLGMVVIMFYTLVEKSMVVMPSSIVYILMGDAVFELLKLFTTEVLSLGSFNAYEYTNLGNMSYVTIDSCSDIYIRSIVVALIYIVISYVVSALAVKRKDIN